jgi:hypothetical protein
MKPRRYDPEVILEAAMEVARFYARWNENTAGREAFACNEIEAAFSEKYRTWREVETDSCIFRSAGDHKALFFNLFHPEPDKSGFIPLAFWSYQPQSASNRVTSLLFLYHILLDDPDFDFNP